MPRKAASKAPNLSFSAQAILLAGLFACSVFFGLFWALYTITAGEHPPRSVMVAIISLVACVFFAGFGLLILLQNVAKPSAPQTAVLIVDDSARQLMALSNMVEALGFTVQTANSGDEALTLAKSASFAFILLDHHMPGLSGPETARKIRQLRGYRTRRSTPIFACTSRPSTPQLYSKAGMNDVLPKPVSPEALVAMLDSHGLLVDA